MADLSQNARNFLVNAVGDRTTANEIIAVLNAVDLLSSTEAGYLDGITPGTSAASKVLSLDANSQLDTIMFKEGTTHCIDAADAITTKFLETGTYQSSADGGITLSDTNTRPVSFLFDDSAAALTGNNRAVLSRVYLALGQGSGGTIVSIQGQLKIGDNLNFGAGRFCGVDGYMEFGGTTTIASGSYVSAMNARVDVAATETVTVASGGYLCGIHVHTTGTGTLTSTGSSFGILINDIGTVDDWKVGIGISNSTTGIDIGTCTTALTCTGTISGGVNYGSATLTTDASRENSFRKCGTYTTQKTLTVSTTGRNAYLFQMNVKCGADLTGNNKLIGHYNKFETGVACPGTRLKVNENYCVVGHAVYDAHVVYGELFYASGYSEGGVTNEGFGGAFTVDTDGGSTPPGLLYGIKARIKGDNLNTGGFAHCAAFFVTEDSTFTNTRFTNLSGATITNMIDSNQAGTCANFISLTGAFTNLFNFDAASGFVLEDNQEWNTKAGSLKIVMPSGATAYINIYDGSAG